MSSFESSMGSVERLLLVVTVTLNYDRSPFGREVRLALRTSFEMKFPSLKEPTRERGKRFCGSYISEEF